MKKSTRETVWNKYNRRCAYCGESLKYKNMQVDHIHPKALGGLNHISNYNPSCRACNFYKSTFTIEGFRERVHTLHERLLKDFTVRLSIKYGIIKSSYFKGKFYYEIFKEKI